MVELSMVVIEQLSSSLINLVIQQEGYNRVQKLFFPKKKYQEQLAIIINDTIKEYKYSKKLYKGDGNKFPFYDSQIFLEILNKHILFSGKHEDIGTIIEYLKENPNIIIPSEYELISFYELFINNVKKDKRLKQLFVLENYKDKIFEISQIIEGQKDIVKKLDEIESRIPNILSGLEHFAPIDNYITRKVSTSIHDEDFFTPKITFTLKELVCGKSSNSNKYILYSSDQTGKTTELKHFGYQLQLEKKYSPYYIDLNKFMPTRTFISIIKSISEQTNKFIMLDAYDEIIDSEKNNFLNELNQFIVDYPHIPILISSRKNFEDKKNFNTFKPLYLEGLSYDGIKSYAEGYLKGSAEKFINLAIRLEVYYLLQTPFYLKKMLEYYSNNDTLPNTKSELYRLLIDESFKVDEKHKQDKGQILHLKTKGYNLLQKVAFVMTECEKKELTENELLNILSKEQYFQMVNHFTIFKRNKEDVTYSFEHIAFKEFLTADFISTMPQEEVYKMILYPDSKKLIKTWYNIVLLFIESIQDESEKFQEVLDVLLSYNSEVIIDASPSFLSKEVKINIFRKEYNKYKRNKLYIDYFEFRKNIIRFANYEETIIFLLDQLQSKSSIANYYNALVILEYADYSCVTDKNFIKVTLKSFLKKHHSTFELKDYVMLPFNNKLFANSSDIKDICSIISTCRQPEVINELLTLMLKLKNVDLYSDWIFEVEEYIYNYSDSDGVNHFIHRTDLYSVYDKFKEIKNILKAINNLILKDVIHSDERSAILSIKKKLFDKLSSNFLKRKDNEIINSVIKSFINEELRPYSLDEYKNKLLVIYKDFFEKTDVAKEIVQEEFRLREGETHNYNRELLIPLLISEEIFINKMHSYERIDVKGFNNMIGYLPIDKSLNKELSKLVDEYFICPKCKPIDQSEKHQKDFDLVLDYKAFKEKVNYQIHNNSEIINLSTDYKKRREIKKKDNIENSIWFFLEKCDADKKESLINNSDFYEEFALKYIVGEFINNNWFTEHIRVRTSDSQKNLIKQSVFNIIENGRVNPSNICCIITLIVYYDISLEDKHICNLLPYSDANIPNGINKYDSTNSLFNYKINGHNFNALDVLIGQSDKYFLNKEIKKIILDSTIHPSSLYYCFSIYITKRSIIELYELLPIILFEKFSQEEYIIHYQGKIIANIATIDDSFSLIGDRLNKVSNETLFIYLRHLKGENIPDNFNDLINKLYSDLDDKNDKKKCLAVMLYNGCEGALNEFILYLKISDDIDVSAFTGFKYESINDLELLLEALELITIKNNNRSRLRLLDIIFQPVEKIAMDSFKNYYIVKEKVRDIVKRHEELSFLNRRLISMEENLLEKYKPIVSINKGIRLYDELMALSR